MSSSAHLGELGEYQTRVYSGEFSHEYSIVGAPEGRTPVELDVPEDTDAERPTRNFTYDGDGGVPIGSFINKVCYATKLSKKAIFASDPGDLVVEVASMSPGRRTMVEVAP